MRTLKIAAAALALCTTLAGSAWAADNDTQTVTFEVTAINELAVSGDPGALVVSTATAGSQPDAATDTSTTYAVTTNGTGKKVTGAVDTAMPSGTTLAIDLTAPSGGSSAGATTLTDSAADLVTGVTQVIGDSLSISYSLTATVAAGVVASDTRTVTLTLTDG